MAEMEIRRFGKVLDAIETPSLTRLQGDSYDHFLQADVSPAQRDASGLHALLHEIFPIVSYDGSMQLEYLDYDLGKPRYSPDECRQLKLTYGMPFRIRCRLSRKGKEETMEDSVYLGEMPIMIGGGEFIINGAERVIVSQLHRSPGVDFVIDSQEGDRPLHACRIIPERGSWIEINVTKKDVMVVRIDQSSKLSATTFLRSMSEKYSKTEDIIREFYTTKTVPTDQLTSDMWSVGAIVDTETGEELVKAGCQISQSLQKIQQSSLKKVEVLIKPQDLLILNSLAEDTSADYDQAVIKIYSRLRPGNPAQIEKAKAFFKEKFYDENRYRLGRVGRFRLNRKFHLEISESEMTLKPEDFLNSMKYIVSLRSGKGVVDDIDHLGNRRLRTIDELAADELRKGFLKLRRSVQERMSIKDPDSIERIAELINSKSVTSAIDFFFGRGELSQVVDQTNPLSQLTHERRLSALGPGGLNRKRAGFEVRDVHISHYGRVCPIETPEGTNIGLIASLSIFANVDEYGFLVTPYRRIEKGRVKDVVYLRADQEMEATLSPTDILEEKGEKLIKGMVLARVDGDLAQVDSGEVRYVDVSSKQTVGVSAALIPFLEHDDANRALMGSNMQRQAVPLLKTEPPLIGTGLEREVAKNSSMLVRARKGGTISYVDGKRIVIDGTDEYVLRKFVGLNERTCLNQKPIIKMGQKVKTGQIIADGAATREGQLALGRNVLVGFMMYDGYNFEDAILLSEKLVKEDAFTSIHIEEYEIEIRETKLGREEFTRDIPNVSEKMLANLDEGGVVREGTYVRPGDILVGKISPKSKSELSPEEKLLYAIFGRAGEDVKNDSLEVPSGEEGIVIDTKRFSRRMYMSEDQRKAQNKVMKDYKETLSRQIADVFRQMARAFRDKLDLTIIDPNTHQKVGMSASDDVILEQVDKFTIDWIKPKAKQDAAQEVYEPYRSRITELQEEMQRKLQQMKRGDELPSGVLEMVKIYIATKRRMSVGDKMAGRHGNKGVIARILPEEDMPFMEDGTPLEILLNPLGVPSRMNVGQILETHLGWAAKILGFQAITPVFDGATEEEVHDVVEEANEKVWYRSGILKNKLKDLEYEQKILEDDYAKPNQKIEDTSSMSLQRLGKIAVIPIKLRQAQLRLLSKGLSQKYSASLSRDQDKGNSRKEAESDSEISGWFKTCSDVIEGKEIKIVGKDIKFRNIPEGRKDYQEFQNDEGLIIFKNGSEVLYIGATGGIDKPNSQKIGGRLDHIFSGRSDQASIIKTLIQEEKDKSSHSSEEAKKVFEKNKKRIERIKEKLRNSEEISGAIEKAGDTQELFVEMPYDGKLTLYDGRTGEPLEQNVAVGNIYMMKLHHLVDDKIHARATGPYSLITQQPLGGKARTGGQRFGEMEVWGLEAYGTAYILQELLTVKSDDVEGRTKIYESMVKGTNVLEAGTPVSFDVLCNEIRGLGLNIQLEKKRIG
jgi:DNA-directed RNA polymerase subunit beta